MEGATGDGGLGEWVHTLRRRLADWARTGVLRHMHSMLVGMLRDS